MFLTLLKKFLSYLSTRKAARNKIIFSNKIKHEENYKW